jgi:hypothetical protein
LAKALAAATPASWATTFSEPGTYAAFDDHTIRLVDDGKATIVAGRADQRCPSATDACGDGGLATNALLGDPSGLAVGLDGSIYIADPVLHRVLRIVPDPESHTIDSKSRIVTVAGDGRSCPAAGDPCGDDGEATQAQLAGPYGIWIDPRGQIYVADGRRGIRRASPARGGKITGRLGGYDARSVVGAADGSLYVATPDAILKTPGGDRPTRVVGTGTPGYNGNRTPDGDLAPGTAVQVKGPRSLSIATNGDVIFADSGNDLIRAYVPSSGHVIDLAGSVVDGHPRRGANGDGHWADETELDLPFAVTAMRRGLFVASDANGGVRRFGASGQPLRR